jgi:hypothetical protein
MVMVTLNVGRPEFLAPSSDFGPMQETHHTVRRQAEAIEAQLRIEKGVLHRLPPLFHREQEIRIAALEEMRQQAMEYAYALYKQERS